MLSLETLEFHFVTHSSCLFVHIHMRQCLFTKLPSCCAIMMLKIKIHTVYSNFAKGGHFITSIQGPMLCFRSVIFDLHLALFSPCAAMHEVQLR